MPSPERPRARVLLLAVIASTNATNFAFNAAISRSLGPRSYGAFGATLGILVIVSVPATALQVALTRAVAQATARLLPGQTISVRRNLGLAIKWALLATAGLVALSPVLRGYLHLSSTGIALLLAIYAIPVAINLVPRGLLLGEQRYRLLALGTLTSGLARLAVGSILVAAGAGVAGALAASVIGEVLCGLVLLPGLRHRLARPAHGIVPVEVPRPSQLVAVSALSAFWVLNGVDTVMARHYLSGMQSGLYSAASVTAGVATFLPTAIAPITLPRAVGILESTDTSMGLGPIVRVFSVVTLLAAVGAGGVIVFGGSAIRLVYGPSFAGATSVLWILALSAAALALLDLLIYLLLAAGSRAPAWIPWIGVLLFVACGLARHSSRGAIASDIIVATCLATLCCLVASTLWWRTRTWHSVAAGLVPNRDLE